MSRPAPHGGRRAPRIAGCTGGRRMAPWPRCRRGGSVAQKSAACCVGGMAPWMALLPPGKGGGAGGARGGKGTGRLLHRRTEGGGMPLANRPTPAQGDERAHVLPWLDAVKSRTGQRGRPRNRRRVIATE